MGSAEGTRVYRTEVTVPCHLGIHARNAVWFIYFVNQYRSNIRIRRGSVDVDGKSILGVLVLGASWNSKLQIETAGEDAEVAVKAIEDYFRTDEHCADDAVATVRKNDGDDANEKG